MSVLYICYQSLRDPLTQTQVVAYLEGLAPTTDRIILFTFEPALIRGREKSEWKERLASRGIVWTQLRYHRRPTLPATLWDIVAGTLVGWRLVRGHKIALVHARSHVPAVMGSLLKRLTGVRFLFDFRGLLAEEYIDGGVWRSQGLLFRLTKWAERRLVKHADALVVLTERARQLLHSWYPRELANKQVRVIPCCTDIADRCGEVPQPEVNRTPDRLLTIAYVGKLGGWYLFDEMAEFIAAGISRHPQLRWEIWTQSETDKFAKRLDEWDLAQHVSIGRCRPEDLPERLARSDAGLLFYGRQLSASACSPTKAAEYLAAGVPVVSTPGIGDLDAVLRGEFSDDGKPVGVIVSKLSADAYAHAWSELFELLQDPHLGRRCRDVARQLFDLRRVGWPRYRQVYSELLGTAARDTTAGDQVDSQAERNGDAHSEQVLSSLQ